MSLRDDRDYKDVLMDALDDIQRLEGETGGKLKHAVVLYMIEDTEGFSVLSYNATLTQTMWERVSLVEECARRMRTSDIQQRNRKEQEDGDN